LNISNILLYWFEYKFTDNSHCPQKEAVIPCSYSRKVSRVFTTTIVVAGTGLVERGFETAV